jgi:hypothetical protein
MIKKDFVWYLSFIGNSFPILFQIIYICLRMNYIRKMRVFYKRRINQQKLILETIMDLKIL